MVFDIFFANVCPKQTQKTITAFAYYCLKQWTNKFEKSRKAINAQAIIFKIALCLLPSSVEEIGKEVLKNTWCAWTCRRHTARSQINLAKSEGRWAVQQMELAVCLCSACKHNSHKSSTPCKCLVAGRKVWRIPEGIGSELEALIE